MPLSEADATQVARDMMKVADAERKRLDRIRDYLHGEVCNVYVPKAATREYKQLVDMARVNIMGLVVSSFAQNLFVEGYRPARKAKNAKAWDLWQANRMDARQAGLYRSAIAYGPSYAVVLPAKGDSAVIEPYSPRYLSAVYDDPLNDEWPVYAQTCSVGYDGARRERVKRIWLYDETSRYQFTAPCEGEIKLEFVGAENHDLGVTPVVRFLNEYGDVDSGSQGEVEPLMPLQDQINNTTFGLLMAQQYSAFRQRWVTGMAIPEDENGAPVEPFKPAVNRLFHAESPDTKFGEFGETSLEGYLASRQSTMRIAAAIAEIPPHALLVSDGVANLSAEALAALEAAQQRKVTEKKTSFGESVEQMMRLASKASGDEAGWDDTSSQVVWRDTESRSLAQVADAYGKLATMLAIPPKALWGRIPGVTDQDVQLWEKIADAEDGRDQGIPAPNGAQPPNGNGGAPGANGGRAAAGAGAPA